MDLVEQLFDDGQAINHTAGAGWLGDDNVAVGIDFRYRIPDLRKTGNVLVSGIGEISAGDLRTAFEQMSGKRSGCEPTPVVRMPLERM